MRYFLDKIIPDNIDEEVGYFLLLCCITPPIYFVWGIFDERMFMVFALGTISTATLLMFTCTIKDVIKNDDLNNEDWIFLIFAFLMSVVLIVLFTIEFVLK